MPIKAYGQFSNIVIGKSHLSSRSDIHSDYNIIPFPSSTTRLGGKICNRYKM